MKNWIAREVDEREIDRLSRSHSISPHLARVILGRGFGTDEEVRSFLEPSFSQLSDPFLLTDMEKACSRLKWALKNGEKIGIFGDYDVDGVCSTAILWDFLEQLGGHVCGRIPNRLIDGYGLNIRLLKEMKEEGVALVVTVDCGITNHEEVLAANKLGMEVIVVDHHTVPKDLPNALALINPHHHNCLMNARYLCAAGVVFYLCMALRKTLRNDGYFLHRDEPNLRDLLDLVALATVSDVMLLKQANRVFVQHGLQVLKKGKRLGLKTLVDVANIDLGKVSSSTLGFQLGPRINAAGRLDDAGTALRLLRMKDSDEALRLARTLDSHNAQRREEEKRITKEAVEQIEASNEHKSAAVLVVYNQSWHPGVVGIVASRLVERFGKPAIVIGADGKGSGRSIAAFHLHDAVQTQRDLLIGFGGHAHAIGLHIKPSGINAFFERLNEYAHSVLRPEDFIQSVFYDGAIDIDCVDFERVAELNLAAPFGRGNAEPLFLFQSLRLRDIRALKGGHIRGVIEGHPQIDIIAFSERDKSIFYESSVDVLASIEINTWGQKESIQLRVKDVRGS